MTSNNYFPHHSNCNANYPEKPEGEKPQEIMKFALHSVNENEYVEQCVDCGAYRVIRENKKVNEDG